METILTPVSPGELIDKITILRIKSEMISDAEKLKNVKLELRMLSDVKSDKVPDTEEMKTLEQDLLDVNKSLWSIEDDIRDCERSKDFGETFVKLARSVYMENDKRAAIKKKINLVLGSTIVEEKSYAEY